MSEYGKKVWFIPDCYYPGVSTEAPYVSHEAICVLNTGKQPAHIDFKFYFEDAEPDESFHAVCEAERTSHFRLDKLKNAEGRGISKDRPYAAVVESDVPVFVQYTRVDTSQERLALATAMAIPM